tara:strand:- start:1145 stop:1645 length:501 start_codon:yes stop_codon:yes gene_type:complete
MFSNGVFIVLPGASSSVYSFRNQHQPHLKMLHKRLPTDPRIVDEIFSTVTKPGLEEVGWLLAMVATYGKTPLELKGFSWNEDNSINIPSKKRSVRPLHPQWVFLFQLKEKQPSKLKSRWNSLTQCLSQALEQDQINLKVEGLLLAHKVRKVYYTPLKQQKQSLVTA